METNLTELRANLYKTIDHLIQTGEPVEIKRKGHIVKIISVKTSSKFSNIIDRKYVIASESDELVNNDWLSAWSFGNDLS